MTRPGYPRAAFIDDYDSWQRAKNGTILFLREILATESTPEDFRYSPADTGESAVRIEDHVHYNEKEVGQLPLVTVARSSITWRWEELGSGNILQGPGLNDNFKFTCLTDMQVIIRCFAKNGLQAERCAAYISSALVPLSPALREAFKWHKITGLSMSPETIVVSDGRPLMTMVAITMGLVIQKHWDLTRTDLRELGVILLDHLAHYLPNQPDEDKIHSEIVVEG